MNCQFYRLFSVVCVTIPVLACRADDPVRRIARDTATQPAAYRFTAADEQLLDEVEHACFLYFWREVGNPAPLAKDRKLAPVASIAAIGFQLSSLPIGVERGWVTRAEAEQRAKAVLQTLFERKDNKKFGVYLHYPDMNTGGLSHEGFEVLASTVDHALLMAGAITAAQYFKGDVAKLTDRMLADTNWRAFVGGKEGFISMGWKPDDPNGVDGPGGLIDWQWWVASDEERLVYFLASGAPNPEHATDPALYHKLKREVKHYDDMPPYVVSWPGTLFTYFFSHCWIDYRRLGPDNPAAFGFGDQPAVDWWENSRRATLTHRRRCLEQAKEFKTFGDERWGLSVAASRDGYIVPEVRPNIADRDDWCKGTVAPYAAGSAIMFIPEQSVAALRAFRNLKDDAGQPFVWLDPNQPGGYGLVDCFNLDQQYASDDYVGIDHGPMLLAIENARTGLIWRLFMGHEAVQRSVKRLRLAE